MVGKEDVIRDRDLVSNKLQIMNMRRNLPESCMSSCAHVRVSARYTSTNSTLTESVKH